MCVRACVSRVGDVRTCVAPNRVEGLGRSSRRFLELISVIAPNGAKRREKCTSREAPSAVPTWVGLGETTGYRYIYRVGGKFEIFDMRRM